MANIKSIIGKQTSNSINEISVNNTTITDPVTIANKFNEYFTSVGKDLAKKIPKVSGSCCDYIKGNYPYTIFLNPVNKTEILDIIHGLQPNKVAGHDDFSRRVIKAVAYIIADPLASVFNISISTGVFPEQLKIAKVTPVFKADDKLLVSNYTDLFQYCPFSQKILEKLLKIN